MSHRNLYFGVVAKHPFLSWYLSNLLLLVLSALRVVHFARTGRFYTGCYPRPSIYYGLSLVPRDRTLFSRFFTGEVTKLPLLNPFVCRLLTPTVSYSVP